MTSTPFHFLSLPLSFSVIINTQGVDGDQTRDRNRQKVNGIQFPNTRKQKTQSACMTRCTHLLTILQTIVRSCVWHSLTWKCFLIFRGPQDSRKNTRTSPDYTELSWVQHWFVIHVRSNQIDRGDMKSPSTHLGPRYIGGNPTPTKVYMLREEPLLSYEMCTLLGEHWSLIQPVSSYCPVL